MREKAGDREGAETLARQAADAGHGQWLASLARMREEAGDSESAETLYRQAANTGQPHPFLKNRWPYGLDPDGSPTPPWL
ncbi:hypothetical protein A6P39_044095 (plasmid) [Streptomyces sp. FXJ1.172]|uniref:hypothetical protein n=1 Tax=Streptomyces sp. FXJ1.172 TaxID=710705 RepID=UPI0023DD27FA|nr:hypothetical protein [Streptomyces sp. FXJ1.172]WEP00696.1 hypothetical protein A6P39_044095 [Streptomyces sp. FXJ1.172]